MAWEGSNRKSRLPADWNKRRRRVHVRDRSLCQVRLDDGRICGQAAVDVDHIVTGDDHSLENLRCICDWHHKKKSAAEGAKARNALIWKSKQKFRRTEKHPGLR